MGVEAENAGGAEEMGGEGVSHFDRYNLIG